MPLIHTYKAGLLLLAVAVIACVLVMRPQEAEAQATITPIQVGSSVSGRIDPADDVDFYRFVVSATTDIWVYTTGDLNTAGGLHDRSGDLLVFNDNSRIPGRWLNFHVRLRIPQGVYYIGVTSADQVTVGNYTLHVKAVSDPGSTRTTAKRLYLNTPAGGAIDRTADTDYFRLDLNDATDLYIYVRTFYGDNIGALPVDTQNRFIEKNQYLEGDWLYIRDEFPAETYYIWLSRFGLETPRPVYYTIHAYRDVEYREFLRKCENLTDINSPPVGDSLYGCQWYLRNHSVSGHDINVEAVWAEGITGEGVNVAVVDDGMYFSHEDLNDNVNTSLNHDYTGDGNISSFLEHHGTQVSGVLAARDNDTGIRGVAPRATIYGYNFLRDTEDANMLDAMSRNQAVTAVSNNSWGAGGQGLSHVPQLWTQTLQHGVTNGYDGRGTLYTFAVGNNYEAGSNANLEEIINSYMVTPVCAVNERDERASYSEVGANLWVCGPSGSFDPEIPDVVTTENFDRYVDEISGTSFSTPMVSGVAALVRQANPLLSWRDVKLILAGSARQNDPTDAGWFSGARKYRAETDADRYHFNYEYGFGVVDAGAAVSLAKDWDNLPELKSTTAGSGTLNMQVPDYDPALSDFDTTVSHQISMSTDIEFTEYVEVEVEFQHDSYRDLSIELVSPSGGSSWLALPYDTVTDDPDDLDTFPLRGSFRLGSARHLGENPNGTWTLRVTDHFQYLYGTLTSWKLTAYGHTKPAPAPEVQVNFAQSAYSVTEGGTVAVVVSLDADPQRTVAVPLVVTHQGGATADDYSGVPESVTFVGGGPTQQTFSFMATDDQIADANESVKLAFGALPERVSTGTTAETTVLLTDNDVAGITVNPTSLTVLEGTTGTYTVKLNTQPSETVTVMASTDNTDITATPEALMFNSAIWNTAQTVTVTAAQDDDAQNESATVTHTVSGYGTVLNADSVVVTVTDDEPEVEVSFVESAYSVTEGDRVDVVVSLSADPQRTVVVPVTVTNLHGATDDDYSGIPESVTFVSGGSTQQLVSLTATDDDVVDPNESVNLRFGVLPAKVTAGITAETVVSITDNDAAGQPTVQTSLAETPLVRIRTGVPVAVMFNQPVSGFGIDDITVTNGHPENLTGESGGTNYSFDVVPTAIGVVTVDVAAGAAQNSQGQDSLAAEQLRVGLPYDDDHNGIINREEVITAIGDYLFGGQLTRDEVITIIGLYLFG